MTDLTMSQFASKDDLLAAQAARIAELESQLEAIGAGGVEPLRKQAAAPQEEAIAEIVSASHDQAEFGERAINFLRDFQHLEYGTKLYPAPQAVQAAVPEAIEQMAVDRYKVVPSHESMFHRWAVVAGNGTQQLYIGREVECQNMALKFTGAFLDGAFVAMQNTAPAHPAEGVPAQTKALRTELVEATETADSWRRLALQFDGHRMQALWHLKRILHADSSVDEYKAAEQFLAAPPLDGEAVLAQRIAALAATQPAAQGMDALTPAVRDVLAERKRQIEQEGYDTEHDDGHINDEIAAMAAIYLMPEAAREWDASSTSYGATMAEALLPADWNFPRLGTRRDQLVKGVAMGLAEIERTDRGDRHA